VSSGHVLAMHLRRAYLTLHRRADARFAAFELTADQFVVLTLLAEKEAVTQQHLTRRSLSDPNTKRERQITFSLPKNQIHDSRQPFAGCSTLGGFRQDRSRPGARSS